MHMRKGLCNSIAEPGSVTKKNASPAYEGTGSHHHPLLRPGLSWGESAFFKNKQYL